MRKKGGCSNSTRFSLLFFFSPQYISPLFLNFSYREFASKDQPHCLFLFPFLQEIRLFRILYSYPFSRLRDTVSFIPPSFFDSSNIFTLSPSLSSVFRSLIGTISKEACNFFASEIKKK